MWPFKRVENSTIGPATSSAVLEPAPVQIKAPQAPKLEPPKSSAVSLDEEAAVREWLPLAKDLGLTCGKVPETELLLFLQEEGIHVYRTQAVLDYLTLAAGKATVWKLHPLRKQDKKWKKTHSVWAAISRWPPGQGATAEIYRNLIPYPVLLTIKKLVDRFGGEVKFFVAAVDHDPFLGVVLQYSNIIFVERWDESAFRE